MEDSKDLSTKSTAELVIELSKLDKEIPLKIMKYNLYSMELHKRFRNSGIEEAYKTKILVKDEIDV